MAHAADYQQLKRAYTALEDGNLAVAAEYFIACIRTAKISFNLGVLSLWRQNGKESVEYFRDALQRDRYFSLAAFYLGFLQEGGSSVEAFKRCLVGFRNCCQFIDYTASGLPFLLEKEDVLYNLAALQEPTTQPSLLNTLSITSISNLLIEEFTTNTCSSRLRLPPFQDRRMIFNLLPKLGIEPIALKGPEHVTFVDGEEHAHSEFHSGFPDARHRQLKLKLLKQFK